MPPSVFTKRVEIRWRDMDAFKHVNNSVYLTYLEETRDDWFLEVLGNGLLLNDFVLARCAVDFRSPLTQDDGEVDVRCAARASAPRASRWPSACSRCATAGSRPRPSRWPSTPRRDTGKSRPLTDEIRAAFERWLPDLRRPVEDPQPWISG